jgi:hypothetical protein
MQACGNLSDPRQANVVTLFPVDFLVRIQKCGNVNIKEHAEIEKEGIHAAMLPETRLSYTVFQMHPNWSHCCAGKKMMALPSAVSQAVSVKA